MLDRVADGHTEGKHNDLRDGKEGGSEDDVSNGPAVLEGTEDEDKLRDNVHHRADEWPEDVDDPEAERLVVLESGNTLEGGDGDEHGDTEDRQAGETKELQRADIEE